LYRPRTSFLAEFFLGNGTPRFPTWQAVRTDRWKYIRYLDQPNVDELDDLASDPTEMKNNTTAAGTREEMKRELDPS
jgi:N-acetylglucosamine-6-sulfatase